MINQELEQNLNIAFKLAQEQKHEFVTVEHLLLALLDNKDAIDLLESNNVNIDSLKVDLEEFIGSTTPKISNETDEQWEGCLSIPGMLGLVKRYKKIKYEGLDMNGNIIKKEAEGLEARVVQHEYDHLMGILYTSRLVNEKAFGFSEEIEDFWKNKNKNQKDNNESISN